MAALAREVNLQARLHTVRTELAANDRGHAHLAATWAANRRRGAAARAIQREWRASRVRCMKAQTVADKQVRCSSIHDAGN